MAEKLAAKLDSEAQTKAQSVLEQAKAGADFEKLGGKEYGFDITKTNPNVPPQVVDTLFKLNPGQVSNIIIASPVQAGQPVSLEIVKVLENDGTNVTGLKDVNSYIKELKEKQPPTIYVKF